MIGYLLLITPSPNYYLILFQNYLKWAIIMLKIFIITIDFTVVSKCSGLYRNSFPIINTSNKINVRKKAKSLTLAQFMWQFFKTFWLKFTQKLIFDIWRYFTEATLISVFSYFKRKCCFIIDNTVFQQNVDSPMVIEPALFWMN